MAPCVKHTEPQGEELRKELFCLYTFCGSPLWFFRPFFDPRTTFSSAGLGATSTSDPPASWVLPALASLFSCRARLTPPRFVVGSVGVVRTTTSPSPLPMAGGAPPLLADDGDGSPPPFFSTAPEPPPPPRAAARSADARAFAFRGLSLFKEEGGGNQNQIWAQTESERQRT